MQDNDRYRLGHMVEFCQKLILLRSASSEENLEDDWVKMLAVTQLFEMLGEAAKNISSEFRSLHPEVPWRGIITMRNRLIHGYDDIDYDLIWEALEDEVPLLLEQVQELLQTLP